MRTPAASTRATSPSSRKTTSRVQGTSATGSEATKFSPRPRPRTIGGPERAATSTPGSRLDAMRTAYAPVSFLTAARTAASRSPENAASISCAKTSVSVSLLKRCPAALSATLRSAKFSKIPLCTTTICPVQSVCGWALISVGRPCVAQRVWPMPVAPGAGDPDSFSARLPSLPGER